MGDGEAKGEEEGRQSRGGREGEASRGARGCYRVRGEGDGGTYTTRV